MKIKDLRVARNLTQEELAKLAKVKRSTVAMWETGKSKPRADVLLKLSKILQCSIDDLVS